MTPHDGLLVHSQPVNRTAALHVAGGDQLDREELLWAQREAFERAITDARLHNMERRSENRRGNCAVKRTATSYAIAMASIKN